MTAKLKVVETTKQVKTVSPLPVGRYWLDIAGQDLINDWGDWKKDVSKSIRVESNEENMVDDVNHLFVIFNVVDNAAFFPADRFGYPNTAPSYIKSSQDVLGVPDNEDDPTTKLLKILKTAGLVAGGVLILKFLLTPSDKKGS